jgi:hypothetical protein
MAAEQRGNNMAADDFYTFSARQRLQQLDANKAQCLADLQQAKAASDYDTAGQAVQEIANIEAQKQNIVALHQQYVASQRVPQAPELSQEERHAKPADRMDWSDVYEMSQKSKHGVDDDAFRAGCNYVIANRGK